MASKSPGRLSRRAAIKTGIMTGMAVALGRVPGVLAQSSGAGLAAITKAIPSTGEKLPVIGLGTNAYSVTGEAQLAACREVLQQMPELGGKVIDTARAYGESEVVIGNLLESLGNRDELFVATKTPGRGEIAAARAVVDESFRRLQVERIDLLQIHNLHGAGKLLPVFREYKQSGMIRYYGVTTSSDRDYPQLMELMKKQPLDFIQVDYSLGNRNAAQHVLPLARERGMAVLVNMPLGGRRGTLMSEIGDRKLPAWSAQLGVESWPQLFLKYVVSHPAVTVAIAGTTKLRHLQDNLRAGRGQLPDAQMRREIERVWDA